MTTAEVLDFWAQFCEEQSLTEEAKQKGAEWIKEDPEYWADASMWSLAERLPVGELFARY